MKKKLILMRDFCQKNIGKKINLLETHRDALLYAEKIMNEWHDPDWYSISNKKDKTKAELIRIIFIDFLIISE